jgi:SAM-dependent methyltransferase
LSASPEPAPSRAACIVCGSSDARPFHPGLLRCAACTHGWADVELTPAQQAELYRRDYFFGDEYLDYVQDRAIIQKNFRARLAVLERFLDPARHRTLLEVGCAYGFFLDLVRDRLQATGIDITEDGVRHARETLGLDAILGDLLTHDFGGRRFDVACLWDTIEHLPRPDLFLEKIAALTEPGALLAVTTGDIGSLNARLGGKGWRLVHPPTHLHYFTRASLLRLLDRHGFEPVYDRSCGFYRGADFTAYNLLVLRWKLPRLYALVKKLRLTGFDFYLDLFDIRYVVARRR